MQCSATSKDIIESILPFLFYFIYAYKTLGITFTREVTGKWGLSGGAADPRVERSEIAATRLKRRDVDRLAKYDTM